MEAAENLLSIQVGAEAEAFVRVNTSVLKTVTHKSIRLKWPSFPEGIQISRKAISQDIFGAYSWVGQSDDGKIRVLFTFKGKAVFGKIETAHEVFLIEPAGDSGLGKITRTDKSDFRPNKRQDDPIPVTALQTAAPTAKKLRDLEYPNNLPQDALFYLDILVAYTNGFGKKYRGDFLDARLAEYFLVFNQCLEQSQVNVRVRLVGKAEVVYPDGGALYDAWKDLAYSSPEFPLYGWDGYEGNVVFEPIHVERKATGADAVVFFRRQDPSNDAGGWAGAFWNNIGWDFAPYAFCVNQDSSHPNSLYIPPHEVGHLLGLNHNYGENEGYGRMFEYSNGIRFGWNGSEFLYMTLMSYRTPGGFESWIGLFSNPRITYSDYVPGNEVAADASRSINEIRHISAGWGGPYGSLRVNTNPKIPEDAGVKWSLNDGHWHELGTTLSGIPPGDYSLRFKDEVGKDNPPEIMATVKTGKVAKVKDSFGSNFLIKRILPKPSIIAPGESFQLITKIKNRSQIVSSYPTKMTVYLSQDKLLSPDDKRLASVRLGSIRPKKVKSIKTTITNTKAGLGLYFVLISIKSTGQITASSKSLNLR